MTSDRIKEIQEATAYPESRSVSVALHTVWNETLQEINQRTCESCNKKQSCEAFASAWNQYKVDYNEFVCSLWEAKE